MLAAQLAAKLFRCDEVDGSTSEAEVLIYDTAGCSSVAFRGSSVAAHDSGWNKMQAR
jgi:hypothetical protein